MPSELRSQHHGAALVLTLGQTSGPQSLSPQLLAAGVEALGVAESDPATRVVVLRGEGADFCAPCSVGTADPLLQGSTERLHALVDALRVFPKPVIAAVEGRVADAGFSLAMACDLVVASRESQFLLTDAQARRLPQGGVGWHLGRALPRQLAQQLLWLGGPVAADLLHRHGLVNEVCDAGQSLERALVLAQRLQTLEPEVLAAAKELLAESQELGWVEHLAAERRQLQDGLRPPAFRV